MNYLTAITLLAAAVIAVGVSCQLFKRGENNNSLIANFIAVLMAFLAGYLLGSKP